MQPSTRFPEDPEPRTYWPPEAKLALGCGLFAAFIVVGFTVVFSLGVHAYFGQAAPTGMKVKVTVPAKVRVGQSFPLTITVRNEGGRELPIDGVSAGQALLRRLKLEEPQPPAAGVSDLPFMEGEGKLWSYSARLQSGGEWKVRFNATPTGDGPLSGRLQVRTGSVPQAASFEVEVAPSGKQTAGKQPSDKQSAGKQPSGTEPSIGDPPAGGRPTPDKPSGNWPSGEWPSGNWPSERWPSEKWPSGSTK